jgi:hypothetical protein
LVLVAQGHQAEHQGQTQSFQLSHLSAVVVVHLMPMVSLVVRVVERMVLLGLLVVLALLIKVSQVVTLLCKIAAVAVAVLVALVLSQQELLVVLVGLVLRLP